MKGMWMSKIRTSSADDTVRIGKRLGDILKQGDVVCITGGLGAGKTAFTQGIASALGIQGYITSPTFTIVNEYNGKIPLYHFDVYRVGDPEEMFEIGFEEYLDNKGVVVIEWADLIRDILPSEYIWIDIKKDLASGEDIRVIDIEFKGGRYGEYENQLSAFGVGHFGEK